MFGRPAQPARGLSANTSFWRWRRLDPNWIIMEGSHSVARPCCPPRWPLRASPSMTDQPPANDPTNPLWELTLREAQWRRGLGKRIHDDIVQVAVAARIKLDQLDRRAPQLGTDGPTGDSPRDLLDHIRRSALEMCHELRAGDVRGALEEWARETNRRVAISGSAAAARHPAVSACAYRGAIELLRDLDPTHARVRLLAGPGWFSMVIRARGCDQPRLDGPAVSACLIMGATVATRARADGSVTALHLPDDLA